MGRHAGKNLGEFLNCLHGYFRESEVTPPLAALQCCDFPATLSSHSSSFPTNKRHRRAAATGTREAITPLQQPQSTEWPGPTSCSPLHLPHWLCRAPQCFTSHQLCHSCSSACEPWFFLRVLSGLDATGLLGLKRLWWVLAQSPKAERFGGSRSKGSVIPVRPGVWRAQLEEQKSREAAASSAFPRAGSRGAARP